MKNEKHSILIPIILVLSLLIFTIPLMLAKHFNDKTILSCANLLSYYGTVLGSLLGAAATIGAVLLTIAHNKKEFEERRILSVKPYLKSDYIRFRDEKSFEIYDENILKFEIDLEKHKIVPVSTPPSDFLRIAKDKKNETGLVEYYGFSKLFLIIEYSLENIGASNALNLLMTFENDTFYPVPHVTSSVNQKTKFHFYFKYYSFKENDVEKEMPITIKFLYSDINSEAIYEQVDEIIILRDLDNILSLQKTRNMTPPKLQPQLTISDLVELNGKYQLVR